MRSTIENVTFRQGFRLPGHDTDYPAGTYAILREDERLEGLTFEAFRRVATFLRVEGQGAEAGRSELRPVSEQDLDAALLADQAGSPFQPNGGMAPRKDKA
jgi:hypothetical protein